MPGIDWGSQIVDQVNALITANGGVLVHDGLLLLAWIGVFKLLLLVIPMLLRRLDLFHGNWHTTVHFSEIFLLLFQIALAAFALNHWMVPLAGGLSLHQVPTALARGLTNTFDTATIDQFVGYLRDTVTKLSQPNPWQVLDIAIYLYILIEMGVLAAAMFVVSSFGFIGVFQYTVLGPLFIPLALTKHFYSWFWRWLEGLFAFSMYRVMAAAIGWVWSNLFIYFFVHGVGTDYSLTNWLALLPVVFMLAVGFVYSMFKIPALTAALFSGAGSIGQSYVSAVSSGVRTAIAAI
ncbi:MAG TPA: type IV secretion system protein [Terracidiphilus sp.]|jgi:TrbL/VirB6 plasmid conjugal transfer protein|nr:type IV secretion system protein [Terracidiphilus sp.]